MKLVDSSSYRDGVARTLFRLGEWIDCSYLHLLSCAHYLEVPILLVHHVVAIRASIFQSLVTSPCQPLAVHALDSSDDNVAGHSTMLRAAQNLVGQLFQHPPRKIVVGVNERGLDHFVRSGLRLHRLQRSLVHLLHHGTAALWLS